MPSLRYALHQGTEPYLIRIRYVQSFLLNIDLLILFVMFVSCIVLFA